MMFLFFYSLVQGYARMTSVISKQRCQDLEDDMGLGGVFTVEWLYKESLSFQYTQHIFNQWNDNKEVQISRDGQVSFNKCCSNVSKLLVFVSIFLVLLLM